MSLQTHDDYRREMVAQIRRYGVKDPAVLAAMGRVPRHRFIPGPPDLAASYADRPVPIGHGQTISQPYIVAYMTERLALSPGDRVLEVGTGSGYQAAILAELGVEVYTLEVVPALVIHARAIFDELGYGRIHLRQGSGYGGWADAGPFDGILTACAPVSVPPRLVEQLGENGRMILPVGDKRQYLVIVRKREGKVIERQDLPVRFVPMV